MRVSIICGDSPAAKDRFIEHCRKSTSFEVLRLGAGLPSDALPRSSGHSPRLPESGRRMVYPSVLQAYAKILSDSWGNTRTDLVIEDVERGTDLAGWSSSISRCYEELLPYYALAKSFGHPVRVWHVLSLVAAGTNKGTAADNLLLTLVRRNLEATLPLAWGVRLVVERSLGEFEQQARWGSDDLEYLAW